MVRAMGRVKMLRQLLIKTEILVSEAFLEEITVELA